MTLMTTFEGQCVRKHVDEEDKTTVAIRNGGSNYQSIWADQWQVQRVTLRDDLKKCVIKCH